MYCRDQRNQAFKDFSGVIGLVVVAVMRLVYSRYVMSLWAKISLFGTGKTYEIHLLFFFLFFTARKFSEDINVESSIPATRALLRHEWCCVKLSVEGAVRLLLLSCFKGGTCMGAHVEISPMIFHLPQLAALLVSHRSQEDFSRRGGEVGLMSPFPLSPAHCILIIDHVPPLV